MSRCIWSFDVRLSVLAVTGLIALAAGCDSVLGIPSQETLAQPSLDASDDGDDAGAGAGVNPCNPDADTNDCFRCTDTNCCSEYMACQADPRCPDYYKTCIPNCEAADASIDDCIVQCDKQYGAGHALFAPYFACTERHCLAVCDNQMPDPCTACMYSSCTDPSYACDADRQCDTLFHCLSSCNGKPFADQCSAACKAGVAQEAQDKLNAELACGVTFCQNACGSQLP
jgi:hypothetical protein